MSDTLTDAAPDATTEEVQPAHEYSSGGDDIFSGEMAVDTKITANEASSWLQRHQRFWGRGRWH